MGQLGLVGLSVMTISGVIGSIAIQGIMSPEPIGQGSLRSGLGVRVPASLACLTKQADLSAKEERKSPGKTHPWEGMNTTGVAHGRLHYKRLVYGLGKLAILLAKPGILLRYSMK